MLSQVSESRPGAPIDVAPSAELKHTAPSGWPALGHGVGQNSVDPDGREEEGRAGEQRERERRKAGLRHGGGDDLAQGCRLIYR